MLNKTLLVLALVTGMSVSARAGVEGSMTTAKSSNTVVGISLSSSAATSIAGGPNNGWFNICVQNYDTSSAIFCGENPNVSTITANVLLGVGIAPAASATSLAAPMCFPVVQNSDFFCRSGSQTASTRASVYRVR